MFHLKCFNLLQPSLQRVQDLASFNDLPPEARGRVASGWLPNTSLIGTADTLLSGWDCAGKSIVLCWLITDFSTDQNVQINALLHLVAASPPCPTTYNGRAASTHAALLLFQAHNVAGILCEQPELGHTWNLIFKFYIAPYRCTSPPSCPLDGAAEPRL